MFHCMNMCLHLSVKFTQLNCMSDGTWEPNSIRYCSHTFVLYIILPNYIHFDAKFFYYIQHNNFITISLLL